MLLSDVQMFKFLGHIDPGIQCIFIQNRRKIYGSYQNILLLFFTDTINEHIQYIMNDIEDKITMKMDMSDIITVYEESYHGGNYLQLAMFLMEHLVEKYETQQTNTTYYDYDSDNECECCDSIASANNESVASANSDSVASANNDYSQNAEDIDKFIKNHKSFWINHFC